MLPLTSPPAAVIIVGNQSTACIILCWDLQNKKKMIELGEQNYCCRSCESYGSLMEDNFIMDVSKQNILSCLHKHLSDS